MTSEIPDVVATATRMILLRHGEPDPSVRGRCYGRLDVGLSPHGRDQMRRARRLLRGSPLSAIYSSPSRRAVESAGVLAGRHPRVTVDDRLGEIDFGEFEGLTYDAIAEGYPQTYAEWMTRPTDVVFPGGESFGALTSRVRDALSEIRRTHLSQTIAIVSHAGVNRVALATALELDARQIFRLDQSYACVNVIDYIGDEPFVRLVNRLPPPRC
jgi:alpha-ribazole phosphatase